MKPSEYIRQFDVLSFDMTRTFMFGGDRFTPEQDYEATYKNFGGINLSNDELHEIIYFIYGELLDRSRNVELQDDMLTVGEFIEQDEYFSKYSAKDKEMIELTFAHHECGSVSESCKETLLRLSANYKLCVISNVWCKSSYFIERLKKDSVFEVFDLIVYSSDHKTVKPSQKIFKIALDYFNIPNNKVVHIGDNYKRDIVGAKNSGISAILVDNSDASKITGDIKPDMIISQIEELG